MLLLSKEPLLAGRLVLLPLGLKTTLQTHLERRLLGSVPNNRRFKMQGNRVKRLSGVNVDNSLV